MENENRIRAIVRRGQSRQLSDLIDEFMEGIATPILEEHMERLRNGKSVTAISLIDAYESVSGTSCPYVGKNRDHLISRELDARGWSVNIVSEEEFAKLLEPEQRTLSSVG